MNNRKTSTALAIAAVALSAGVASFLAIPGRQIARLPVAVEHAAKNGTHDNTLAAGQVSPAPVHETGTPSTKALLPLENATALDPHRRAVAAMLVQSRETTKRLYGGFLETQGLQREEQAQLLAILTMPERALADAATDAIRAGTLPTPPSAEFLQAQKVHQDEALRSLIGDDGYAAFAAFRLTIPDRIILDAMSRRGANLTDEQSLQLLGILGEERNRVANPQTSARKLAHLSPAEAAASIQQDHRILQEAARRRAASILDQDQLAVLGDVLSRLSRPAGPR
jgi:hypothetical protein